MIGSRHIRRRASAKKERGQQYERGGENKTLIGALLQIDFLVKRFSHTIINERVPELCKMCTIGVVDQLHW